MLPPNMIASCASGCTYTCRAGFGDCDGNSANGCETDLSSARDNCGNVWDFLTERAAAARVASGRARWSSATGPRGRERSRRTETETSTSRGPSRSRSRWFRANAGADGRKRRVSASFTRAGTFRWLRQIESSATDYLQSIAVTGSGASTVVAVAGGTQTNIDFGGGALTAPTSSRGFVAVYNGDGVYRWAHMWFFRRRRADL